VGIPLPEDASAFDLSVSLQAAIDDRVREHGGATDVSEMAQQAAGEALASLTRGKTETLFGGGREELLGALRGLSTSNGFGALGQRFFGCFIARLLNFYLSRATAAGVGSAPLPDTGAISQFNDTLRLHCDQSARVVRDFCGGWLSKTEYEQGITPRNTAGFLRIALRKLRDEITQQRNAV